MTDSTAALEPSAVVSITMSFGAIVTALTALIRVSRWMGHTDALQAAHTQRLDEIRDDLREIRAVLIPRS
jgi:hypothetical protein